MCEQCGCGEQAETDNTLSQRVRNVIDTLRPMLQGHGGDVELVGVDGDNTVRVRLQGACSGCPGAKMTLKMGIEQLLREEIPQIKEVIAVD